MLGAIAGDIVGSVYERCPIKSKAFPLFGPASTFTDDSVCTVAIADCLMNDGDIAAYLRAYVLRHPWRGYGGMFLEWARNEAMPAYGSWGNGAAMRVSAIAYAAQDEDQALDLAARTAAVSHDHPDAIAGAQATVLAMWQARHGAEASAIRSAIEARFGYDLSESVEAMRLWYSFDVSCAGTVPPAIRSALEARDYEDAVRNAISLGGDSDTLACITGGLAETLFGLPDEIAARALGLLTDDLRDVVTRFRKRYGLC